MAALTPLLSPSLVADRAPQFITALLQLYKKLGPSSSGVEVTLCLSPLLQLTTTTAPPALLDPVIDPLYNTMFQQICIPMDFEKAGTVKNHHEMLRCYDTMMQHSPEKLVAGLLVKADNSEEKLRVGEESSDCLSSSSRRALKRTAQITPPPGKDTAKV